jgi:hypothetical protein
VKNANKFLNQNKATVVFIVATEVLLVHQFSRTKNVADRTENKEAQPLTNPRLRKAANVMRQLKRRQQTTLTVRK